MLWLWSISGTVPFTGQYSGRHSCHWNWKTLLTVLLPEFGMGKIELGLAPG